MSQFRLVRQFDGKTSTSESRAYRVETTALMTEQEAMQLMRDLGSPYGGKKYQETTPKWETPPIPVDAVAVWGTDYDEILSEPTENMARELAHDTHSKLFTRPPGGQWQLVAQ